VHDRGSAREKLGGLGAAAELGVSQSEVQRSRKSREPDGSPDTVVGLDGKTYKAKGKAPEPKAAASTPQVDRRRGYRKAIAAVPPVTEESDPDVVEEEEEEIVDPAQIEDNILYTLERTDVHALMFRKHIKLIVGQFLAGSGSTFTPEAEDRLDAALDKTIRGLQRVKSDLPKNRGRK